MPLESASSRPRSVYSAVFLAVAAPGVGLVNTYRYAPQVSPHTSMGPILPWAVTLIGAIVWFYVIALAFRGQNGGRIVLCIFAALSVPETVLTFAFQPGDPLSALVDGAQTLLLVCAAVLLLIPASGRWYREMKAMNSAAAD